MIPQTMKAIRFSEHGDPSVLRYLETETPRPGPREVLVAVRAAGVSNWDAGTRRGGRSHSQWRPQGGLPFQPGREAAGVVAAIGADVTRVKEGDVVALMSCLPCGRCALCRRGMGNMCRDAIHPGMNGPGGYAEFVVRDEIDAVPAPARGGQDMVKLSACLWAYSTVWNMAFDCGGIGPGADVLITGASGALGLAALQLCRVIGARQVFGTTGRAEKAEPLLRLGYDHVIPTGDNDLGEALRGATGGRGVNLVVDCVGGALAGHALKGLCIGGTLVTAARLGDGTMQLDTGFLFVNGLKVIGTRGASRRAQELMVELFESGRIDPVIAKTLPLADAAEAHRLLEDREIIGRIVLIP